VPTLPALVRARHYLDKTGASGKVTLIITGGLRLPGDFIKALALGADGIALANSAIQAIGCVAARICHTNKCRVHAKARPSRSQRNTACAVFRFVNYRPEHDIHSVLGKVLDAATSDISNG